jgi:multidrug efflux system membrane fusion protein
MKRYLNSSVLVFVAIIVIVAVWIGSGMIGGGEPEEAAAAPRPTPVVAASWSEAAPVDQSLTLYGEVEPTQIVIVRARTDGIVESIVDQGTEVASGDEIAQLSSDDREARLARAQAGVATAEQSYEAARQLAERRVGPEQDVRARLADLEAARAELRAIELEISNTTLVAPISGTVNRIVSDIGAYVSPGGEILEIVDNDPLVAVIQVQQSQIVNVRRGMTARVAFIGGDETEGRVTFVSPLADAATRTFRVEVEVPNPGGEIPAGLSAEVTLVTRTVDAHHISAALVRLDEQGRLGLYTIEDDDTVLFRPVETVMADSTGIWVTGLEPRQRLVTITQGVSSGETVQVEETPEEYRRRVIRPSDEGDAGDDAPEDVDVQESE